MCANSALGAFFFRVMRLATWSGGVCFLPVSVHLPMHWLEFPLLEHRDYIDAKRCSRIRISVDAAVGRYHLHSVDWRNRQRRCVFA